MSSERCALMHDLKSSDFNRAVLVGHGRLRQDQDSLSRRKLTDEGRVNSECERLLQENEQQCPTLLLRP